MGSRTIIVGDIHGCYDELIDLLDKVSFGSEDRLICVGDLITKGPKNREVLDRFMSDPQFTSVIGNHDLALRRRWNGEKFKLKPSQKPTNKDLKKDKERYLPFLNRCLSQSIWERIWLCTQDYGRDWSFTRKPLRT